MPDELLVERVVGRRLDPVTGAIYHMKYKPPAPEIVDRLQQRSDDTEEKVGWEAGVLITPGAGIPMDCFGVRSGYHQLVLDSPFSGRPTLGSMAMLPRNLAISDRLWRVSLGRVHPTDTGLAICPGQPEFSWLRIPESSIPSLFPVVWDCKLGSSRRCRSAGTMMIGVHLS